MVELSARFTQHDPSTKKPPTRSVGLVPRPAAVPKLADQSTVRYVVIRSSVQTGFRRCHADISKKSNLGR